MAHILASLIFAVAGVYALGVIAASIAGVHGIPRATISKRSPNQARGRVRMVTRRRAAAIRAELRAAA